MTDTLSPPPARSTTGEGSPRLEPWALALGGALSAGAALATSVLLDGVSARIPPLIASVGQAVIRLSPGAASRQAIDAFGTANKTALLTGTVLACLAIGALVGTRSASGLRTATFTYAAFAVLGLLAAVDASRAAVAPAALTAVLSAGVGLGTLAMVRRALDPGRSSRWAHPPSRPGAGPGEPPLPIGRAVTRRRFLTVASAGTAGSAVAVGVGRIFQQRSGAAAARADITLPAPGQPAAPVPTGASLAVAGATPPVTPNADFFRIDEALVVPSVDVGSWELEISGMVDRPLTLTYDDLLARDLVERHLTIACVSNPVGGDLIGTARWLGVRLADLLEEAGVDPRADQVVGRSVDRFTVGFPTALALDGRDALVAIGMNGEPLPQRHGFPARLVVPGLYGYVSATKWLRSIELTTFDAFDPYWVQRGWAADGPVKTQSRIDVPRDSSRIPAGPTTVAGVAWGLPSGVEAVEVRIDDGPWQAAELAEAISDDTWRLWSLAWDATPGSHRIEVRATDGTGTTQDPERRPVFPDGATGHHDVVVDVD